MNPTELYKRSQKRWGVRLQSIVTMEECAELIQAVTKYIRFPGPSTKKDLAEELADVQIMIEQLAKALDIENEVAAMRIEKLKRLEQRLNEKES